MWIARVGFAGALFAACSSFLWAQQNLRDVAQAIEDRDPGGIRTQPAPCQLPNEAALRVANTYRDLLLEWSRGGVNAARGLDVLQRSLVDRHAGFEVTDETVHNLLTMPNGKIVVPGIGCLERVEMRVSTDLFARVPQSAVSTFAFYLAAWRIQDEDSSPPRRWLASRNRDRMVEIVDTYLDHLGQSPEALEVGASMLMALGDAMRQSRFLTSIATARQLFARAARMAPAGIAAPYWSAILAERLADYEAAATEFEHLARRLPGDEEIRLRMAINFDRTGRRRMAVQELETLTRVAETPWVRLLAFQELARAEAARVPGAAAEILRRGLEAFPDDPRLTLLLLPRLTDWMEIDALAERVSSPEEDPGPSARLLYDVPRTSELEEVLRELDRREREAAKDLERWAAAAGERAAHGFRPEAPTRRSALHSGD